MKRVGILIFENVDELAVAGPFKVFGLARAMSPRSIDICLVAPWGDEPVTCAHGMRMFPDYGLSEASGLDLLLLPGGRIADAVMEDAGLMAWIGKAAACCAQLPAPGSRRLSVVAATVGQGRWPGYPARAFDPQRPREYERDPIEPLMAGRWDVVTPSGLSGDIDMALWILSQLSGDPRLADQVRAKMTNLPEEIVGWRTGNVAGRA